MPDKTGFFNLNVIIPRFICGETPKNKKTPKIFIHNHLSKIGSHIALLIVAIQNIFRTEEEIVRNSFFFTTIFLLSFIANGQNSNKPQFNDRADSLSYIIGRDVGSQLKDFGATVRMPQFTLGVEQAMKGEESPIDSSAADSLRKSFADEVQRKMQQEQEELANKNKKESDTFLSNNKKQKGVQVTKSGLQYKVIQKGSGPKPTATDSVRVIYKGMLIDNTVFDSTTAENPATLDLQRTIPGISEGIQLMSEGATYRFFVPPDLAYGPTGAPPVIPPNSVLIFDITLQEILGKQKNASQIRNQ